MTLAQRIVAFIPPLQRWYPITTPYGGKTAKGPDAGEPHWGLDFGTPIGTPLYAISDGIVRPANSAPGGGTAGNTLVIDYGNGITVLAGHLSDMFVKPGDRVRAGDWIANTGNTGITTGPHLHLQAWRNGQSINPLDLFDWTRDAFDPDAYATSHGAAVPVTASKPARITVAPGEACPPGYIKDPSGPNRCISDEAVLGVDDLPFADWGEAITGLVTAILNPENWARIFAIVIGFLMTGAGAFMVWQSV